MSALVSALLAAAAADLAGSFYEVQAADRGFDGGEFSAALQQEPPAEVLAAIEVIDLFCALEVCR